MRYLRPAIGFTLSGIAVVVLARGTDWEAVGDGLAEANLWLIAAVVPVLLLLFGVRAYRWRLFFPADGRVTTWPAFKALNIGYMAGNLLPLQMGEIARVYALGEMTRESKAKILSTVGVERILDLALLLLAALVLGPFIDLPAPATFALIAVVVVLLAAVGVLLVAAFDRGLAERLTDPFVSLLPDRFESSLRRIRASMLDGVTILSDGRQMAIIVAWTAVSWLLSAAVIYILLQALHIDVPVTAAPFLLIATTLAFLLPSSPGAVGVYDAVVVTSLVTAFGVDRDHATSYALVAHACYIIPPTILGAYFWWSMSLRLPEKVAAGDPLAAMLEVDDDRPAVTLAGPPLPRL